jgi:nitrogen fixation protein FixH
MFAPFADKTFRDRWLWVVFPMMFLVVMVANGALVYYALSSWPGLAYENASERGRKFNQVLAEGSRENALGWHFSVFRAGGAVVVEARDRDGRPLTDLDISAKLVRPLGGTDDRALALRPAGPGRYAAETDLPFKGQWELRLLAERAGERVHATDRFLEH